MDPKVGVIKRVDPGGMLEIQVGKRLLVAFFRDIEGYGAETAKELHLKEGREVFVTLKPSGEIETVVLVRV